MFMHIHYGYTMYVVLPTYSVTMMLLYSVLDLKVAFYSVLHGGNGIIFVCFPNSVSLSREHRCIVQ